MAQRQMAQYTGIVIYFAIDLPRTGFWGTALRMAMITDSVYNEMNRALGHLCAHIG